MFDKHHQVSLKDAANSTDESVFHPLPTLFRLLGLNPFKKVVVGPVSPVFHFYFSEHLLYRWLYLVGRCYVLFVYVCTCFWCLPIFYLGYS